MSKFLLSFCFIFCIASASTCLERIIYADEIATVEVQFNYIRFLVSPCTSLCGCDQNPAAVGIQLLQSVALYICCQAGSRAACCWRVLAKWIYEATHERSQRLGLNDDCFTCVFVSTCCIPISLAFILSLPLYFLSLLKDLCICSFYACSCDVEQDSCKCSHSEICDLCDMETGRRRPAVSARSPRIRSRESGVITRQPSSFVTITQQPQPAGTVIRARPTAALTLTEIVNDPVSFFVGILFIVFTFYFSAAMDRINRPRIRNNEIFFANVQFYCNK